MPNETTALSNFPVRTTDHSTQKTKYLRIRPPCSEISCTSQYLLKIFRIKKDMDCLTVHVSHNHRNKNKLLINK